jgi:hypothetical protein
LGKYFVQSIVSFEKEAYANILLNNRYLFYFNICFFAQTYLISNHYLLLPNPLILWLKRLISEPDFLLLYLAGRDLNQEIINKELAAKAANMFFCHVFRPFASRGMPASIIVQSLLIPNSTNLSVVT